MRYTAEEGYAFDTSNRAWQRFNDLLPEHFQVVGVDPGRRPPGAHHADRPGQRRRVHRRGPRLDGDPRTARAARRHRDRRAVRARPIRRRAGGSRARAATRPHRHHPGRHLPGAADPSGPVHPARPRMAPSARPHRPHRPRHAAGPRRSARGHAGPTRPHPRDARRRRAVRPRRRRDRMGPHRAPPWTRSSSHCTPQRHR